MADPQDIVEIGGRRRAGGGAGAANAGARRSRFLSIWFRCCHTYGRLQRNRSETAYEGRCPRCGAKVRARIGPDGSRRRIFEAS